MLATLLRHITKMKSLVVVLLPFLALDVRGNKATVQCNKVRTEFNDCTYKWAFQPKKYTLEYFLGGLNDNVQSSWDLCGGDEEGRWKTRLCSKESVQLLGGRNRGDYIIELFRCASILIKKNPSSLTDWFMVPQICHLSNLSHSESVSWFSDLFLFVWNPTDGWMMIRDWVKHGKWIMLPFPSRTAATTWWTMSVIQKRRYYYYYCFLKHYL